MKYVVISLLTLATSLAAPAAFACGFDEAPRPVRPTRPVTIFRDDVEEQLRARAARLDAEANSLDSRAVTEETRARALLIEARGLRQEAAFTKGDGRSRILALAESIAVEATGRLRDASDLRREARELRVLAQQNRDRLRRPPVNGGRWRTSVAIRE